MKTSKPASKASTEEECGVWLDTLQLKRKSKQKQLTRPITKLLNPLAESGGYSLAVALNFTQTKIQMPNTKQSSISSFFTPQQRRVLSKRSTSEVPNTDPVDSSSSSSTSTICATPIEQPCREVEEDSLAMLFTQDSEGFRVIAHHGLSARSLLRDQTNLSIGRVKRTSDYPPVVEDEEEEAMLFTQDSQGNTVIKH
ncbi:uncharacterized protein aunip [Diretmus argenteus]